MKHSGRTAAGVKSSAYLYLTGAMGIAGSSVVAAKTIACRLPIFLSGGCSLALAVAILWPMAAGHGRDCSRITRRDALFLSLQALTGVFLFRVALFYGLKRASAMEAGVIVSTMPALTAVISCLLLRDGLTWRKAAGIFLAVAGLLIVNIPGGPAAGGGRHPCANLLVFGAVAGEALFTVLQKKVGRDVPAVVATARICLYALILFLPGALYEALHYDFRAVRPGDLLFIAYYGLVVTALAYILFIKGAQLVPASTAGMFYGLMPVSSALLSFAFLGERMGLSLVVSLVLVLLGILLLERTGGASPSPPRNEFLGGD